MSKVDLNTNKEAILKLHKEVSDPKSKTDWTLFGYQGQSNVLKVVDSGDGGIEELQDELSGGKIQYAYCKLIDPNTDLPKFVLINWQGEGVPELKKGKYAHHFEDVKFLLKGAHVTLDARCDDDIDEDDLKQRLSKASGSNYSVHREVAKPQPAIKPVASVYQRTLANQDISKTKKNAFWEKQMIDEKQRKDCESEKKTKERENIERERKERELLETQEREKRERDRIESINRLRLSEKTAAAKSSASKSDNKQATEMLHRDALQEENERKKRADGLRSQRNDEAKQLISQRSNNPKLTFESRNSQFDDVDPKSPARTPGKLSGNIFGSTSNQDENKPRPQPISLPKDPNYVDNPMVTSSPSPPPITTSQAPAPGPVQQFSPTPTPEVAVDACAPVADDVPVAAVRRTAQPAEYAQPREEEVQPVEQQEQEQEHEQEQEQEEEEDTWAVQQSMNSMQVADDQNYQVHQTAPVQEVQAPQEQDPVQECEPVVEDVKSSLTAVSDYDYQAAEENEVSFGVNETITNIEQIDEGWWIGTNQSGETGLFPANYVTLA